MLHAKIRPRLTASDYSYGNIMAQPRTCEITIPKADIESLGMVFFIMAFNGRIRTGSAKETGQMGLRI